MEWLDILTGEVQARRDSRQHAESQRNEIDDDLRQQRIQAALRFVARPALEQAASRLQKNGAKASLSAGDAGAVELTVMLKGDSTGHVGARPGQGSEVALYWSDGADQGERSIAADVLTSGVLYELARTTLASGTRQNHSG